MKIKWLNQTLTLFPEKALFWEERATLVITDTHFGKELAFRGFGIPIPQGSTADDVGRLDGLLKNTGAERLIILGDFYHHKKGVIGETLDLISAWRKKNERVEVVLIQGNHDKHAGPPLSEWAIENRTSFYSDAPFIFSHEPWESPEGYVLAGHIHPRIVLRDRHGASLRAPCFIFGPTQGLLPAFGSFTGMHMMKPTVGDRVFVVGVEEVLEV